ncbi:CHAP domain-containing protein [Purpureocillium lavendulum]|uniref:CHAP domain-containing protein n=1 Tax=Purpureocillium lavendulum TaxID=1247861 RepID=A0AB34FJX8_9HYPO|nr:CHAP domain-containing protein [Purpureocillium lavendulum]
MALLPERNGDAGTMGRATFSHDGYVMQPRINLRRADVGLAPPAAVDSYAKVAKRSACIGSDCDKAVGTNVTNLAIILGVVIPVVVAVIVLFFLHRRNVRRLRMEDAKDPNGGLDFGLDDAPAKGGKRKSFMFGSEKNVHRPGQLSMDMNLSSPYLLPPNAHQSQESLARNFHGSEGDPYRTVKEYINSETGSIRSYGGSKRASVITSRSMGTPMMPPPRTNSMPKSPATPDDSKVNPFATPTQPLPTHQTPAVADVKDPILSVQSIVPEIGTVAYPDEKLQGGLDMPDVRPPPPAKSRDSPPALPDFNNSSLARSDSLHLPTNIGVAHSADDDLHFTPSNDPGSSGGLGLNLDLPKISSPPLDHPVTEPHAMSYPPGQAQTYDHGEHPEIRTSEYYDEYEEEARGRGMERQPSVDYSAPQQSLGVPLQQSKRLSVGFRPLPPDEVTESEDPEYRANRIRSFYKEYFDDSKEAPPPLPTQRGAGGGGGGAEYYEDYDAGYLGDLAYYDSDHNTFVMPYAQPLKDDSFALLNAIDFAPPDSFSERATGRSQSPLGERRPYQPKLPVASPLVTAFDELAALPSPHLLRKSSTFTNLDFAPPKKFKDGDTMSDAGSIRSNRSGISAMQLGAIRSGAGRVSRLPGDTVFTQAALSDTLKPQWGMRP